jgi:DNA-binding NarL/FixJ family response regulator
MGVSSENGKLSPRLEQTLDLLTQAYAEKQIASRLGVSQHTVHVYVKTLYRRYQVNSRAELLVAVLRPHWREAPGGRMKSDFDTGC